MEKVWLPLSECVQFRSGLMHSSLLRYPWEDDDYAFDFESYYPPIPDGLACIRKLLDCIRKNSFGCPFPEDIRDCPFCPLDLYPVWRDMDATTNPADVDILNHPVWDMDPIPCPHHLKFHVWPQGGWPALITPQELEETKKYLNQVRNSRGYDVDCFPHPNLVDHAFRKCDIGYKSTVKLESTVIPYIEFKTGKNYKFEEILKIVSTERRITLVTFTAKVVDSDAAASETFIATLSELHNGTNDIIECLLKPDSDAPAGPDHYPDIEIRPIGIPEKMMIYIRSTNHSHTHDPKLWDIERTYYSPLFAPASSKRIRTAAEENFVKHRRSDMTSKQGGEDSVSKRWLQDGSPREDSQRKVSKGRLQEVPPRENSVSKGRLDSEAPDSENESFTESDLERELFLIEKRNQLSDLEREVRLIESEKRKTYLIEKLKILKKKRIMVKRRVKKLRSRRENRDDGGGSSGHGEAEHTFPPI